VEIRTAPRSERNHQSTRSNSYDPAAVSLSPRAFKALGIEIAYVKPVIENTGSTYEMLAVVEDRLVAFAMIRRHDLEPASLH
jgi:hypothetical protein